MNELRMTAALVLWLASAPCWTEDIDLHGGAGILFWSPEQQILGYRAIDGLYPTRRVEAGAHPYPLIPAYGDFADLRYEHQGRRLSLDDYMQSQRIARAYRRQGRQGAVGAVWPRQRLEQPLDILLHRQVRGQHVDRRRHSGRLHRRRGGPGGGLSAPPQGRRL